MYVRAGRDENIKINSKKKKKKNYKNFFLVSNLVIIAGHIYTAGCVIMSNYFFRFLPLSYRRVAKYDAARWANPYRRLPKPKTPSNGVDLLHTTLPFIPELDVNVRCCWDIGPDGSEAKHSPGLRKIAKPQRRKRGRGLLYVGCIESNHGLGRGRDRSGKQNY